MGVFDCRRGQTEGIAVILLTGILIVGIGTFGAFYLSSLSQPSGAAAPAVSADVDVSVVNESGTATLTVTHAGGEAIEEGAVILRIRGERYVLPRPFEAGMRNSTTLSDVSKDDVLRVLVVDNASQSVVFQSRVTVQGSDGGAAGTPAAPSDSTPPSVTLDRPTGGETFTGGTTETIQWSASDGETGVDAIDIEYSTDGGSTWSTVVSDTANDGSYDWTVPDDDTDQARIRVRATDGAGNTATDQSGDFTVEPSAGPSVQSATVEDAPINQSEADGTTRDVTITFTEPMDQSVTPGVSLTGISGSYSWVGDGNWTDSQTFVRQVSFTDNDAETNATIEVSDAEDTDGNRISPNPDTSETFRVDTAPPSISNAQATDVNDPDGTPNDGVVNDGDTVEVSADVSDGFTVDTVSVDASDFGAGTVELTDGNGDGTYTATFTVDAGSASSDGSYALNVTATDDLGNVGTSQTGTVELDTNTAPSVNITDVQTTETGGSGKIETVDVTFIPDDADGNLNNATVIAYLDGSEAGRQDNVDLTGKEGESVTVNVSVGGQRASTVEAEVIVNDTANASASDRESASGNSGGQTGSASQVQQSGQSEVSPNNDAELVFSLENTGDSGATITNIRVDSVSGNPSIGRVNRNGAEFRAAGSGVLNEVIQIGQKYQLDTNAVIGSGDTVEFRLGDFEKSSNNKDLSVAGRTVEFTVYYSDGTRETFTFTP